MNLAFEEAVDREAPISWERFTELFIEHGGTPERLALIEKRLRASGDALISH